MKYNRIIKLTDSLIDPENKCSVLIMSILKYQINPFGGAVIESKSITQNSNDFVNKLKETILLLKVKKIKVVWLNLSHKQVSLVAPAVSEGFIYHHADKDGLELTRSLIPDAYIPPYATHYIGAGGVVLDENDNLLIISEKYRKNKNRHFKLPGGTLNQGEHISTAVCREVFEETGIKTEFEYLACLRHWHGYRYGKSDIYFVCKLKPLGKKITIDPVEIDQALWTPVSEYLQDPETHPFNRRIVTSALSSGGIHSEIIEGYGSPETHEMLFS